MTISDLISKLLSVLLRKSAKKLTKAGSNLLLIAEKISKSDVSTKNKTKDWFEAQGDSTLRLSYDLDENSVVFDLGGYEGHWARDIFSRYCCNIHVFEPVKEYATRIKQSFAKNKKVYIYPFGLAQERNEEVIISVNQDKSSIYKSGNNIQRVLMIRGIDFIQEHHIERIDLMKINIEGGEYDLLDHFLQTGFISRVVNIQVQFHDFVPDAENRMQKIHEELSQTHFLTYQYKFIWENWKLKE